MIEYPDPQNLLLAYKSLENETKKKMDWMIPKMAKLFDVPLTLIEEHPLKYVSNAILLFDYMYGTSNTDISMEQKLQEIDIESAGDVFAIGFDETGDCVCYLPPQMLWNDVAFFGEEATHYLHVLSNQQILSDYKEELMEFVGYVGRMHAIKIVTETNESPFSYEDLLKSKKDCRTQEKEFCEIESLKSETEQNIIDIVNSDFLEIINTIYSKQLNWQKQDDNTKFLGEIQQKYGVENMTGGGEPINHRYFLFELKPKIKKIKSYFRHYMGYYSAISNMENAMNDKDLLRKTADQLIEEYIDKELFKNINLFIKQLEKNEKLFFEELERTNYAGNPLEIANSLF